MLATRLFGVFPNLTNGLGRGRGGAPLRMVRELRYVRP